MKRKRVWPRNSPPLRKCRIKKPFKLINPSHFPKESAFTSQSNSVEQSGAKAGANVSIKVPTVNVANLGIDSLMAVELRTRSQTDLTVALPIENVLE